MSSVPSPESDAEASSGPLPPYLGLRPFDVADRDRFFGRDAVVADLRERVVEQGGLVALVGSPGSGKTSILQAGLLAELGGRLRTPGERPPTVPGGDDLLVIDQLEELFTLGATEEQRTAFLDALLERSGPVVVGIRADHYGQCATHAGFAAAVARNQVLLRPMTDDELRSAITGPARAADLEVQPALVELLVEALHDEPSPLPLLSQALLATWEHRDGRVLTIDTYRATGGIRSAIAATADRALEDTGAQLLHDHLRESTKTWDDEGRRAADLYRGARLEAARDWAAAHPQELPPLERLFLATSQAEQVRVVAEQAQTNRRLRRWLTAVSGLLVLSLVALVLAVVDREDGSGGGPDDTAHAAALAATSRAQLPANPELAILLATQAVRLQDTPETAAALRAALEAARIRYRLPAAPAQGCGGPRLDYNPDRERETLVEVLCDGTTRVADARTGEVRHEVRHDGVRPALVRHTADGAFVIAVTADHVLSLDAATGEQLSQSRAIPGIVDIAIHPRRPEVAILTRRQLLVWNASTGRLTTSRSKDLPTLRSSESGKELPSTVDADRFAYTPNGRRLALLTHPNRSDSQLVYFDIAQAKTAKPVVLRGVRATTLAFSPAGGSVALTEAQGRVSLRDANSLKPVKGFAPITSRRATPTQAVFSPDGSRLAYGFENGAAGVVNARTGRKVESFPAGSAAIRSVTFRPDGQIVATGSQDGAGAAWRAAGATEDAADIEADSTEELLSLARTTVTRELTDDERRQFGVTG